MIDMDEMWMQEAFKLARQAESLGEVPIGAVVILDDELIGSGYNCKEYNQNPIAHAEIIAIQEAVKKLNRWRLNDCSLYVTLEPCQMCLGALINARLKRLVYAAKKTKTQINHNIILKTGVLETPASLLLSDFFKKIRKLKS